MKQLSLNTRPRPSEGPAPGVGSPKPLTPPVQPPQPHCTHPLSPNVDAVVELPTNSERSHCTAKQHETQSACCHHIYVVPYNPISPVPPSDAPHYQHKPQTLEPAANSVTVTAPLASSQACFAIAQPCPSTHSAARHDSTTQHNTIQPASARPSPPSVQHSAAGHHSWMDIPVSEGRLTEVIAGCGNSLDSRGCQCINILAPQPACVTTTPQLHPPRISVDTQPCSLSIHHQPTFVPAGPSLSAVPGVCDGLATHYISEPTTCPAATSTANTGAQSRPISSTSQSLQLKPDTSPRASSSPVQHTTSPIEQDDSCRQDTTNELLNHSHSTSKIPTHYSTPQPVRCGSSNSGGHCSPRSPPASLCLCTNGSLVTTSILSRWSSHSSTTGSEPTSCESGTGPGHWQGQA